LTKQLCLELAFKYTTFHASLVIVIMINQT
jgi:hypothetical protein